MKPKSAAEKGNSNLSKSAPPTVGPRMSPIEKAMFHNPETNPYCTSTVSLSFSSLNYKANYAGQVVQLQPGDVEFKNIANGAGGSGFDSQANRINHSRQRLATAATFLRSCVAKALSRRDEPNH